MILKVDDVSFHYKSVSVLNNVSFSICPGDVLSLLGPNGVGKTTLLKCINAVHRPSSGSVFVDKKNVYDLSPNKIARMVGYVAQKIEVTAMTVFDAVLLGRIPHIGRRVSDHDLKIVDAALKILDLNRLSLRSINQMSGGEQQKMAVARALVQEPMLMLLDEPTSSLDLKNQVDIMNIISRLSKEHQMAVVMTMHDLNIALRYSDKCIFLKSGKIYFAGKPSEINENIIETVYGLPVTLIHQDGNILVTPKADAAAAGRLN